MDSIFNLTRPWNGREEALPRIELIEYERSYTVKVDILDAGTEGVAVNLETGVLTVCSEDLNTLAESPCVLPRLNSFRCALALPDDLDETAMSISCEGRILTLHFDRHRRAYPLND